MEKLPHIYYLIRTIVKGKTTNRKVFKIKDFHWIDRRRTTFSVNPYSNSIFRPLMDDWLTVGCKTGEASDLLLPIRAIQIN